jgi:hypothetical protein
MRKMQNRKYIVSATQMSLVWFILFFANCTSENLDKKAAKIHDHGLPIDTHTDIPIAMAISDYDIRERHDPSRSGVKGDLLRMKEGGLNTAFFAVFISQGPRTEEGNEEWCEYPIYLKLIRRSYWVWKDRHLKVVLGLRECLYNNAESP